MFYPLWSAGAYGGVFGWNLNCVNPAASLLSVRSWFDGCVVDYIPIPKTLSLKEA
jgi:hypothetical protein